jgi:hypothetical protein
VVRDSNASAGSMIYNGFGRAGAVVNIRHNSPVVIVRGGGIVVIIYNIVSAGVTVNIRHYRTMVRVRSDSAVIRVGGTGAAVSIRDCRTVVRD